MNLHNGRSFIPSYSTKQEVFKVAHENTQFFDSFTESLKHAWKFYNN